jgi:hypothetical protein
MADWQFKLDFKEFWRDEEMPVFKKAEKVIERIKKLLPEIRGKADGLKHFKALKLFRETLNDMADELENEILPMFEAIVEGENEDEQEFNNALDYLYDWGDASLDNEWGGKKMCWVSTVI